MVGGHCWRPHASAHALQVWTLQSDVRGTMEAASLPSHLIMHTGISAGFKVGKKVDVSIDADAKVRR